MCILIYMFKTLVKMFYHQEFYIYKVILIFSGLSDLLWVN